MVDSFAASDTNGNHECRVLKLLTVARLPSNERSYWNTPNVWRLP
jgi:hypothetical protein